MKALKSLEASHFKATEIYNRIADLLSWLSNPGYPYATASCEDTMNSTATKLVEYVDGAKQPVIQLFQAVRIFDLKQLPLLSHTFSDYRSPSVHVLC